MRFDVRAPSLSDIERARRRITVDAIRTPTIASAAGDHGRRVFLKLENLQPIGSFKIRPAANIVRSLERSDLEGGLYTASSGNSAIATAWMARQIGVSASAIVPDNAPTGKLEQLRSLGADIVVCSPDEWWACIEAGGIADHKGFYVDAVRDPRALAGDATIGLEIVEDSPLVDAIFAPFGGGGLACGVASALLAINSRVQIIACELVSAKPLSAALAAGGPVIVPHETGFVSGIGAKTILPEMWPLISSVISGVMTVTIEEVRRAIRLLAERDHVVAEGAGAAPVAAALFGDHKFRSVCAIVSGGNISGAVLSEILQEAPRS